MIGIISGTGKLPIQACKNLLASNKKFFVICLFPKDNETKLKNLLENKVEVFTKQFYKAGEILKLLKKKNTKELLLIGKVDKRNLLKNIKFDWIAIKLLTKVINKSDKNLMEAIIKEIEKENIKVINQSEVLQDLLIKPGILTGKITKEIEDNIKFGLDTATNISLYDIGQTVIVKDKMILAIEAIEGTNECIQRGIKLGKKNIVICKTAHQNQNRKYDLPTLGPQSLENIKKGQVKAIAWHSNQTLIINKSELIKKAQELEITLISVKAK